MLLGSNLFGWKKHVPLPGIPLQDNRLCSSPKVLWYKIIYTAYYHFEVTTRYGHTLKGNSCISRDRANQASNQANKSYEMLATAEEKNTAYTAAL